MHLKAVGMWNSAGSLISSHFLSELSSIASFSKNGQMERGSWTLLYVKTN